VRRPTAVLVTTVAVAACAAASTAAAHPAASGRFVVAFAPPKNQDERILVSLLEAARLPLVFGELSKRA